MLDSGAKGALSNASNYTAPKFCRFRVAAIHARDSKGARGRNDLYRGSFVTIEVDPRWGTNSIGRRIGWRSGEAVRVWARREHGIGEYDPIAHRSSTCLIRHSELRPFLSMDECNRCLRYACDSIAAVVPNKCRRLARSIGNPDRSGVK